MIKNQGHAQDKQLDSQMNYLNEHILAPLKQHD